jgi:hypothetical protein
MPTRDFPSFSMYTDEGDIAVHRMVTCIVVQIQQGRLRRVELEGRIAQGCTWVALEAGHKEVYDTEPQCDIQDAINRACLAEGWQPVSRWDW